MDKNNKGGFFENLVKGSIILSALDSLAAYIYRLLGRGFFGYIFSGYNNTSRSYVLESISDSKAYSFIHKLRLRLLKEIETSMFIKLVRSWITHVFSLRLRVIGVFLITLGIYSASLGIITDVIAGMDFEMFNDYPLMISIVITVASLPFMMSKKNLSEAICTSLIGKFILKVTGFTVEDVYVAEDGGYTNAAFILGVFFGSITYFVPNYLILAAIVGIAGLYVILVKPEFGVLCLMFGMPFLPTMVLVGLTMYVSLCYLIKLIRQKRVLRLEAIDITVMAFAVMLLSGGFISTSSASIKPSLVFVCFILGYFLVSQLIKSCEWLEMCTNAVVISSTLVSIYGMYTYFTGSSRMADAWIDSEMFGSIARRAISTLENPNMLGEYLVLTIPLAVGILVRRYTTMSKMVNIICLAFMSGCLVFTWSRGAWLAIMAAAVVFLFMWHRRAVLLVLVGIMSVPALPLVLPQSIINRFTSIGNLGDSSTSYRLSIWRASVNMIKDNFLSGIGIGEGTWYNIYPSYSYNGIEAAPHSHNLFLQITLELGIVGIIIFVVFLFLFYQSGLTFFSHLADDRATVPENLLGIHDDMLSDDKNKNIRASKTDLRIRAAAPLCGIFGVLVQGMTDYAWYNYRVYLMFWLICGLASAYIRSGEELISTGDGESEAEYSSVDISIGRKQRKQRAKKS